VRARLLSARTLTIAQEAQPHLGNPTLEARLEVIPDALQIAEAYSATEALQALEEHADHPEIATVRDVFALDQIHRHSTWYLTHGLLDLESVNAVKRQLRNGLLYKAIDELAGHLPALLAAFEFDDDILGAPVLADDLAAAWDTRCRDDRLGR